MRLPQGVPVAGGATESAAPGVQVVDASHADVVERLQAANWVDHTALAVLLVFFVIGLFKGLIWQVSRIAILVAAYFLAARFGHDVAAYFAPSPAAEVAASTAAGAEAAATAGPSDTSLYLAYVLVFLAVLVVLSLLAMALQKLAAKAGLSFFDRVGGGVVGIATGACVVLFALSVVHMFFPGSHVTEAATRSQSMRLSREAVNLLGLQVPDDLRRVFALAPLRSPAPAQPHDPLAPDTAVPAASRRRDGTAPVDATADGRIAPPPR